ncbi:hypothetical protein RvY_01546 [Ramazzottius varieornatus]|uniref:Uncharacterized protein n=1 Tax=Ramazzottius varieornatus TaxID=947166 RepID=A0A1D1UKJ9_RAMVA|nr:hypothetical protein RvY_01546 [Ramazzottius varieornatus]
MASKKQSCHESWNFSKTVARGSPFYGVLVLLLESLDAVAKTIILSTVPFFSLISRAGTQSRLEPFQLFRRERPERTAFIQFAKEACSAVFRSQTPDDVNRQVADAKGVTPISFIAVC